MRVLVGSSTHSELAERETFPVNFPRIDQTRRVVARGAKTLSWRLVLATAARNRGVQVTTSMGTEDLSGDDRRRVDPEYRECWELEARWLDAIGQLSPSERMT